MTADATAGVAAAPASGSRALHLDIVRGIALCGIFLMNIESFNRPVQDIFAGLNPALSGIDHAVDWLIYVFVRGKFWILFSLLFGIGFAILLVRANEGGTRFVPTYLRRLGVLAAFGLMHIAFAWTGDILFNYALTAGFLLLILFGRWWHWLLVLVAGAAALRVPALQSTLITLACAGIAGLYLRSPGERRVLGRPWPFASVVIALIASVLLVAGMALLLTQGPSAAITALAAGLVMLALAFATMRFGHPLHNRPLVIGVGLYALPFASFLLAFGLLAAMPHWTTPPTQEEFAAFEEDQQEMRADAAAETATMTLGSFAQAARFRLRQFIGLAQAPLATFIAVFLMGYWLARSGIALAPERHTGTLRRIFALGVALGLPLTLASTVLPMSSSGGLDDNPYLIHMFLHLLGALPLALAYFAGIVLLVQSSKAAWLHWFAPAGRMALTNYLLQSAIASLVFYGYGLGQWGMPRAGQALFVLVVFACQVVLSAWWLRHFRFGPLEWLWRSLTWLSLQPMRVRNRMQAATP